MLSIFAMLRLFQSRIVLGKKEYGYVAVAEWYIPCEHKVLRSALHML